MPEGGAQWCIRRQQRTAGVVGVTRRVLKLPGDVAIGGPLVCVGQVGVVGEGVDNVEGVWVDEIVAETGVKVRVGGNGGHNVSDVGSGLGGLHGGVVGVEDTELVIVGMSEEGAADCIVEAVDYLVI